MDRPVHPKVVRTWKVERLKQGNTKVIPKTKRRAPEKNSSTVKPK